MFLGYSSWVDGYRGVIGGGGGRRGHGGGQWWCWKAVVVAGNKGGVLSCYFSC